MPEFGAECLIGYEPEDGIDGQCYVHADGDPECDFRIDRALAEKPVFTDAQREALAWRFQSIDAGPRHKRLMRERGLPRELRSVRPEFRDSALRFHPRSDVDGGQE